MSASQFIGSVIGNNAARAKHAAIATGVGSLSFVQGVRTHTVEAYVAKDAELGVRRAAAVAARTTALHMPKRQRKLVTA